MEYIRVIPRDFFNDSKILKCFGQLSLKILDKQLPEGMNLIISETGEPFDIRLRFDGHLYLHNYTTTINGVKVWFITTYNSRADFPLLCEYNYEQVEVFSSVGNFTDEFKEFIKQFVK